MKTIKYILISLAIAFAVVGCSGGSGSMNLDTNEEHQHYTYG